jgi:hypothetical protein
LAWPPTSRGIWWSGTGQSLIGEKIFRPGTDAHPEAKTVAYHDCEAGELLGDNHRLTDGEFYHRGGETQLFSFRGEPGNGNKGFQEGHAVEEIPGAVIVVGIHIGTFLRVANAVREGEGIESGGFRGQRQWQVLIGRAHGGVVSKFHSWFL